MKQKARKLLSLLMAFAIVCGMIPAALAENTEPTPSEGDNIEWGSWSSAECTSENKEHTPGETTITAAATCGKAGSATRTCTTCQATQTGTIPATGEHNPGSEYITENGKHYKKCTVCGGKASEGEDCKAAEGAAGYKSDLHNHWQICAVCKQMIGEKADHAWGTPIPTQGKDALHTVNCTICLYSCEEPHKFDPITHKCPCGKEETVPVPATGISLNPTTLALKVGQTSSLRATLTPDGATDTVTWSTSNAGVATVSGGTVTAVAPGTATITAKVSDTIKATCSVTVTAVQGISISVSKATLTSLRDEATLKVTATGFPTTVDTSKTTWSVSSGSSYVDLSRSTGTSITVYPVSKGTATIKASLTVDGTTYSDTCTIKVSYSTEIEAEAMVYNTNPGYGLGEVDDDGEDSVIDQIYDAVRSVSGKRDSLYYVTFDTVRVSGKGELDASTKDEYYYDEDDAEDERGELLSDVVFTPDEDYEGDVSFTFKAYYDTGRNDYYTGVVTFEVKEGEAADGGDILYMAQKGDDVELDVEDFEEFWNDEYSKGSLEYVVFTSVSSGNLYDADDDKLSRDEECYVEPGKRQTALEGVYFTPKKNFTGAVTIGFTATGTTKSSSKTTSDLKGNVLILYTDGEVSDIDYQISANAEVTLDDADFTAIYKDATDTSSKNPTVYIRFLEVPKNGTLYYNYNSKTGRGTELKTSNIGRYFFSNKSSASYGIEDVTYVANSKGTADSIKYAAYSSSSSGSLQYIGTINFGGTSSTPVTVSLNCTSTSLRFQSSTFYAGTSLLTTSSYIVFGTPTSGTLYKNYTGTTGTRVSSADHFAYSTSSALGVQAISTLTYVPATGYTGVVEIPFTSYNVKGGTTSGTVRINVTAVRVTFSDLSTTNWAYQYVAPLAAAGVINGYEDGTFRPANNVTYAEILKMVMLATGYSEQAKTGSHWASGYMSRAITDGILSGQVSLDSAADRNAVAAIVAKAMKLSPITTGYNPFADSTDGYARALYNAGIITGYVENGKTYYKGSTLISRAEIATIIFRVSNAYHG